MRLRRLVSLKVCSKANFEETAGQLEVTPFISPAMHTDGGLAILFAST